MLTVSCGLLAGCATPTQPDAMAIASVVGIHRSAGSVSLTVSGGQETSSVRASQISDADFARALRDSFLRSGLFPTVERADGTYRLQAYIGRVSQPTMGFDMKVDVDVGYTLIDSRSGETLLRKNISTSHVATSKDAFAGVSRLRIATEGAARKNIEALVTEISKLHLQ